MSAPGRMLLDLFLLFAAARLAGAIFLRLRQPVVVGEILAGMLIGPHLLGLVGENRFHDIFAELGAVFLLFVVGLGTNPTDLWRVGRRAVSVAALGVAAPFCFGFLLLHAFARPMHESLFVATALTATSVGITARVLADLNRMGTRVANVILGAAVADDIVGMLVLALVTGITTGTLSLSSVGLLAGESVAFCVVALMFGRRAVRRITRRLSRADDSSRDPRFALAVVLCFAFSALAEIIGLAAIIGAFFAGIIFAEIPEAPGLRRSMQPVYELLVPIFFVLMGARVDLPRLLTLGVLPLGLLITVVAIIGKLVGCGLAALPLGKREAVTVGVGMIPRGEVGIVVALIGLSRGVITGDLYAEVILMCLLTTVVAPPLLRMLLGQPTLTEVSGAPDAVNRR